MSTLDLDLPQDEQTEPLEPDAVEQIFNPEVEDDAPPVEAEAETAEEDTEAKADESDEKDDEPRAQKRIRQEIERRKALEQRNQQLEQQQQVLEQRFHQLMERMNPQQEKAEEVPEFDEDPAAHLLAQQRKIQEQLNQQQNLTQQQQAAQQQAAQMHAVQQRFEQAEQQFAQEHPDYFQRIEGLKQQRVQMWQSLGHDPNSAMQRVQQEAWQLVIDGLRNGGNPAEVFYSMAPPVAAPPADVARENANRQRAGSLGSRSRGTVRSLPSASELASMSEEEFAKATAGDNWRKIAGG